MINVEKYKLTDKRFYRREQTNSCRCSSQQTSHKMSVEFMNSGSMDFPSHLLGEAVNL